MAERLQDGRNWWSVVHNKFVVEERYVSSRERTALYRAAVVLVVVGVAVFLATLIGVLHSDGIASADQAAQHWLMGTHSDTLTAVMRAVAVGFGPVGLPIIVLVATITWGLLAKHAWRPLLLAAAMLTGVGLAQIIGASVQRPRPPVDQMLFGPDHTFSFPSGHVLGASDFLLVTCYLVFSRVRKPAAARVGFAVAILLIVLAAASRLYLGYHWVSDTVASISLSLVVLGAVMALDTWRTVRIPLEPVTGVAPGTG
ncbi:phosphatase PAP2 family protein [Paenarthrobacter sp. NPDC089316]|uniref:phosphatase PAP2 family protein n=1 Tax=unclassified Paenarthrobacter TaxID=2634190 RepID=UPI00343249D7